MDFWEQYGESLTLLGLYAAGIAAFAIAVALLYVPMGTRLMFAKRFGERAVATPGRRFLYVLFFPLVSFAFFLLVAATLFAFGGADGTADGLPAGEAQQALQEARIKILVISMAMVLAIRVTAYFTETGAQEVAKVMPLGLLGYFLVTDQVDRISEVFDNVLALFDGDNLALIGIFFAVVVVVEFLLRGIYELAGRPNRRKVKGTPAPPQQPPRAAPQQPGVSFQRRN
jgi:hypothetical protein